MIRAKKCPIDGKRCPDHDAVHGREAEELRAGVEKLIEGSDGRVKNSDLQRLLDSVDARDSLAFVEVERATRKASPRAHAKVVGFLLLDVEIARKDSLSKKRVGAGKQETQRQLKRRKRP